jgi:hypothetical protein
VLKTLKPALRIFALLGLVTDSSAPGIQTRATPGRRDRKREYGPEPHLPPVTKKALLMRVRQPKQRA